jgi:hypothetical protein
MRITTEETYRRVAARGQRRRRLARGLTQSAMPGARCSTASTCASPRANSWPWSDAAAAAKALCCASIAGLEQADGGTVAIDGAGRADALRLMFQEARLLPWKSVLDNVALGLAGRVERARCGARGAGAGRPGDARR